MPTTITPNPIVQYICSKCRTVLQSAPGVAVVRLEEINEDCPSCGSPLCQSATILRPSVKCENIGSISPFSLASDAGRLTFGISEIDRRFSLWAGEACCIHGPAAGLLIERLCVRALMPARAGGLGSDKIVFIDGGNSSDVYRFVEYARLFGLAYREALRRVVQSRAFTVYQLADVITKHLENAAKEAGAKAIFVSDLFEMFERESNLDKGDGWRLASRIAAALGALAQKYLLVVSLSRESKYDRCLTRMGKHISTEIDGKFGQATVRLIDRHSSSALSIAALV